MSPSSERLSMAAPGVISAEDRFAIEDVLGRYLWAVDTGDLEAVLAVFTRDAIVRYAGGIHYQGGDGLRQFGLKAIGDLSAQGRMHLNQSLFAEATGETVLLRSYVVVPQCSDGSDGVRIATIRYTEDRFRKTPEGWRICERTIHPWPNEAASSTNEPAQSSSTR